MSKIVDIIADKIETIIEDFNIDGKKFIQDIQVNDFKIDFKIDAVELARFIKEAFIKHAWDLEEDILEDLEEHGERVLQSLAINKALDCLTIGEEKSFLWATKAGKKVFLTIE